MHLLIRRSVEDVASFVADLVVDRVRQGLVVLGVATGGSPLPTYAELVRRHRAGTVDLRRCHLVLLDEYVGLPPGHPASYRHTIDEVLRRPLGIPVDHLHTPEVHGPDLVAACERFEALIGELGGVGLQLLGIGRNGHIGFNEPGTPWTTRTHVVTLAPSTRRDNARFFDHPDDVPSKAVTQGIATILDAREVVLIATGATKADVLRRLVTADGDRDLPAAALAEHRSTSIVVDAEAAPPRPLAS